MTKKPKFDTSDDGAESQFNMALASLERLHIDLVNCKICSMKPELWPSWYLNLRNVFKELSCVLSGEELKICNNTIKELRSNRNSHTTMILRGKMYSEDFYEKLSEFEVYLRILANKHGLMYPSKKSVLDFAEQMLK